MALFATPLGMIPDWQYSSDPAVNIKINPHVAIPANFTHGQRTVQPMNYFSAKASGDPLAGLGITRARWSQPAADLAGLGSFFDSWAWQNRKWIALGGVSLVGVAVLGTLTAVLR